MSEPREQWTSGEISGRLENLFEGVEETELGSAAQRAYQEAASVLASFDPDLLNPVPANEITQQSAHELLDTSVLASVSTKTKWVLAPELRRESLKRLVDGRRVEDALAANPDRLKDLLQLTFEQYLHGAGKPLQLQSLRELQASLQVCDWLSGIVSVPSVDELRGRIESEIFLKPLHDLVGERFAGREEQLMELSDYVGVYAASGALESGRRFVERIFSIIERPPLMIEAPGGMGKSTLIAEFILTNSAAQHVQRFPFAYLDFDRPGLIAEEPVTLLLEAVRQFGAQFPGARKSAAQLRDSWQVKAREKGAAARVSTGSKTFVRFSDPVWYYKSFAGFVSEICPPNSPVLLVLDTFEEVQYRSKTFVTGIFDFLQDIQGRIPQLRTVLAGRAGVKLEGFSVKLLKLPPFDRDAAQAFLEKQGIADMGLGFVIADQVGGSPLTLKLAAKLVRLDANQAGPEGIRDLDTGLVAFVKGRSIEAQIYDRILDHIHDKEVQKLAHPGLILRRITEDLIAQVLAGVCGVNVSAPGRARELFDKLAEEIALVESGDAGVLVHRPDVRALTLRMLIDDRKMRKATEAINELAIRYYAERSGSEARAEELYHLLLLDLNRSRVEPRAGDISALNLITRSIDDLPDRSQAFLAARVEIERPDRVWNASDLPDWELYAARVVRENLSMGKTDAALELMRRRRERSLESPLYALEIEGLQQKGDWKSAESKMSEILNRPEGSVAASVLKGLERYRNRLRVRASLPHPEMIECRAPGSPVVYQDGNEQHGDWVRTRGVHTIAVPSLFYISPVLVTNELFREFVSDGGYQREELWEASVDVRTRFLTADGASMGPGNWPSSSLFPDGQDRHPVSSISYREACAFLAWYNKIAPQPGWRWSFPPEDCWEWAARGSSGQLYPWGAYFDAAKCNSIEAGVEDTTQVDKYEAGRSWIGCYDMAGNVWEFVEGTGNLRGGVLRGGSFRNNPEEVRSSLRLFGVPRRHRPPDFGFRLARLPVDPALTSPST
jgi:formylglycine-generating enzyme required for sulfatase activity